MAFSDCAVQDLESIVEWIDGCPEQPDLIIYAGDDIRRFIPDPETNYFEQLAFLSRYGVAAVKGNRDLGYSIRGHKVYDIHSQPIAVGRFLFIGVEGCPYVPHAESEIAQHLRFSIPKDTDHTIVIVSHAPPRGCLDETMKGVGQSGSLAVRDVVKKDTRVMLVVSGHAHLCGGRDDKLGHAVVVNAASHDKVGSPARIAKLLLQPSGTVEDIQWNELVSSFQVAEINGIGGKYAERLAQAGIATIEHLAVASPYTVGQALGRRSEKAVIFGARARARLTGLPSLVSRLEFPREPRLYLDIETDLQHSYTWLVGIIMDEGDEVRQFFASHPNKESEMLRELAAFLSNMGGHTIVHFSGSWFDGRILVERMDSHSITSPQSLLGSVDCLPALRSSLALPTRGMGLKEAAECFGYRFAHSEIDGWAVAYEYQKAVESGGPVPERLLAYNRDDVLALRFLVQQVEQLVTET